MAKRHRGRVVGCLALLLVLVAAFSWSSPSRAAANGEAPELSRSKVIHPASPATFLEALQVAVVPIPHPGEDLQCILCHEGSEATVTLPDGAEFSVDVDPAELAASAHGFAAEQPLNCTSCHLSVEYQFPHDPILEADLRSYEIARSESCVRCHTEDQHETAHAGPGEENEVVCTDCHGSHDVLTSAELRTVEGTAACVACHQESDVSLTDPAVLRTIIRDGLFAPQNATAYCLACHSQPNFTLTMDNGEELSLTVDRGKLGGSVHGADNGWQPLICTDCHENNKTFPHDEPVNTASLREYRLANVSRCTACHESQVEKAMDDVHGALIESGDLEGAVCTDCHGAHDTPPPNQPRGRISQTCSQCHEDTHEQYVDSVHGEALSQNSNEDVPTCIDCHGVHNIADPTTTLYRSRSPVLCAGCHADEELMAKYGISTDVFSTYVSDFHGTSAILFDPTDDPDAPFNEAVCYDCHGVHDIRRVDDPENGINANLLETCQKCHPNATENFAAAWTSHYEPSLQNNTGVFLVETFYQIMIPLTLGGLGFLVATDIFRRVRLRFGRKLE